MLSHHSVSAQLLPQTRRWRRADTGNDQSNNEEVYQVHGDDVRRHKLGTVYQPVCPSHLNGGTFGGRSELDAVAVLRDIEKIKINPLVQLDPEHCGSEYFTDLNVLWEQIVAVGAVVKHDLVEGGGAQFLHLAVVIAAIFVLTDHPLPHCQIPQRCLVPLQERTSSEAKRLRQVYCQCHKDLALIKTKEV